MRRSSERRKTTEVSGVRARGAARGGDAPRRRLPRLPAPYLFLAPAVVYVLIFLAYPIGRGVSLSFTDATILDPTGGDFIGLGNYAKLLTSLGFWHTVEVTTVYATVSVVGVVCVGMAAALLMNWRFRGRGLFRTAVAVPWASPEVAVTLIFAWIFNDQYGVAQFLVHKTHLVSAQLGWLDSPSLALPVILLITIWKVFPFTALVLLAALQSIPADLYEAAHVDGARGLATFRNVVLPGIAPTLLVLVLLLTIWSLRRFTLIWIMTQGGPVDATNTLVVDVYRETFKNFELGYGAAIGMLGLMVSLLATAMYLVFERRVRRSLGLT